MGSVIHPRASPSRGRRPGGGEVLGAGRGRGGAQRVGGDGGFAGTIAGERLLSKNSSVFVFHVCLVLHVRGGRGGREICDSDCLKENAK